MSLFKDHYFEMRLLKRLQDFNFYVDDYQRGYKWTVRHVLDLLNDINEFNEEQGNYCLQPIVVKERNPAEEKISKILPGTNTVYELIDGQQRMTTLYIIFHCLFPDKEYIRLGYGTRFSSSLFLQRLNDLQICHFDAALLQDTGKLEQAISSEWEKYILENPSSDNVDNYHFYLVFQTFRLWLKANDTTDFSEKIQSNTYVIWYEVNKEESSEQVFININSGKIPLTNAELIKALFLINVKKEASGEMILYKQLEISEEWDRIESTLQNDQFWYFINDNATQEHDTPRIDFLFNLIKKKRKEETDPFFSYRHYAQELKDKQTLNWLAVKDLFERLQEWYDDRTVYHLIGFVVSTGITSITKLTELNNLYTKKQFREKLQGIIKNHFQKNKDGDLLYHPLHLNYGNANQATIETLLLFNIETYEKSDPSFRFPFDRFKREKWSLEHIHAQNAGNFTTNLEVSDWCNDIYDLIEEFDVLKDKKKEDLRATKEKLGQLKAAVATNMGANISPENKKTLQDLSLAFEEHFDTHSISNLSLLDGSTNSAIGNQPFLAKRKDILDIDNKGWVVSKGERQKAFIPICTKNAFLKYYTKEVKQMAYWGHNDRKDYLAAICETLKNYLPTTEKLNGNN